MFDTIKFSKPDSSNNYKSLEEIDESIFNEVSSLMKKKTEFTDRKGEIPPLPIMFTFVLSDYSIIRSYVLPKSEDDKRVSLYMAKRVIHGLNKSQTPVIKAYIILEAWQTAFQLTSPEFQGLTDAEKEKLARKKFKDGEIEKQTIVCFHHLLPGKKENNEMYTTGKLVVYDVFEDSILTDSKSVDLEDKEIRLSVHPSFLLFDSVSEEEQKQKNNFNNGKDFEVFDVNGCINFIRSFLQSNYKELQKAEKFISTLQVKK